MRFRANAAEPPTPGIGDPASPLLRTLARRVHELRACRAWSRRELSRRSGLSVRYLARVESGEGNISVRRLEDLALALGTTPDVLVRPEPDRSLVALVGLRGAGKSTVGPLLAERLDLPFVEMDTLILEASGLPRDQLFELHGENYYRRLELETLRRLVVNDDAAVVAAAGGVVNEPATWELLTERATIVWLRASPEDHWNRVVAQGDRRPMADNPTAMEQLRAILQARESRYSEATLILDTSGRTPAELADRIVEELARADR